MTREAFGATVAAMRERSEAGSSRRAGNRLRRGTHVSARVDEAFHTRVRMFCAQTGMSQQELVMRAVEEFMDRR